MRGNPIWGRRRSSSIHSGRSDGEWLVPPEPRRVHRDPHVESRLDAAAVFRLWICGYSLRERIYVIDEDMLGLLIYTADGDSKELWATGPPGRINAACGYVDASRK